MMCAPDPLLWTLRKWELMHQAALFIKLIRD
jgi:hypothetical protein